MMMTDDDDDDDDDDDVPQYHKTLNYVGSYDFHRCALVISSRVYAGWIMNLDCTVFLTYTR